MFCSYLILSINRGFNRNQLFEVRISVPPLPPPPGSSSSSCSCCKLRKKSPSVWISCMSSIYLICWHYQLFNHSHQLAPWRHSHLVPWISNYFYLLCELICMDHIWIIYGYIYGSYMDIFMDHIWISFRMIKLYFPMHSLMPVNSWACCIIITYNILYTANQILKQNYVWIGDCLRLSSYNHHLSMTAR